jgi:hypothetical protein
MEEKWQAGCGCLTFIVMILLLYWIGGVWRTEVTYLPNVTGTISETVTFEEKLNARHWVAGFVKGRQPDLQEAVSKHLEGGKQLTSLTIYMRHTFVDNVLMVVTLGIYAPVTVTVKGSVSQVLSPAAELPSGARKGARRNRN